MRGESFSRIQFKSDLEFAPSRQKQRATAGFDDLHSAHIETERNEIESVRSIEEICDLRFRVGDFLRPWDKCELKSRLLTQNTVRYYEKKTRDKVLV